MVANIIDIQRVYSEIPKEWDNEKDHYFNYDLLDSETHFSHGWRNVLIPDFDSESQKLSDKYVLVNDFVTKTIIDLTEQEIQAIEEAKIPMLLTASQIRQALLILGKSSDDVVTAINQIPDNLQRNILLIRWEFETTFRRNSKEVIAIALSIGVNLVELYKIGGGL